jgi:F420H(2)-dependent quinone reductase
MASLLRNPFSTLTSLTKPPRPGTPGFALWKHLTGLNNVLYRLSGGRIMGSYDGNPVLLLHHVGRRSGEERVTPLIYVEDGEDILIVASMGGTPKHPAWFLNLRDKPDTEVEIRGERRPVTAHAAGAEERERLWPKVVEHYPGFASYQDRTEREIPVVVLSPRG